MLGLLLATGCQEDQVREQATTQALQSSPEQPEQTTPGQKPLTDTTPVGALGLNAATKAAPKGSEVCVAITARNFFHIESMQYTLKWDKQALKFKSVQGFNLPGLSKENFGTHLTEKEGLLTHSWYDASLQGVTRPDGSSLYEVCFEAIGDAGSRSYIEFVNEPVVFEITNASSQFLELQGARGSVEIK